MEKQPSRPAPTSKIGLGPCRNRKARTVNLLEQAFEALKTLPSEDRDRIAWEILARVEDKTEWDKLIASPEARSWLEKEAARATTLYKKMRRPLSVGFVSLSHDAFLREDSYWQNFDDLPADVRKLAESNYTLWKENPNHPSLRFKQIHPAKPIFSFRVGMQHRAVGAQVADGKIAWFWLGSFQHFQDVIGPLADG
jgi:hypothetical protein